MSHSRIPLTREEELFRKIRDFHDKNLPNQEMIKSTLFETIRILDKFGIEYALFGGLAGQKYGRPRPTHDIDILIHPNDAEKVLAIFERENFETERRDPQWIYKAWKNDVLIDLIFKSCGDIVFDDEVKSHTNELPFWGTMVQTISREDYLVIKVAANREKTPHHWFDALSVLKEGQIDWDYLLSRSRYAPRRLLSLLIYAESLDVAIPRDVIRSLFTDLYASTSISNKLNFSYSTCNA